MKTAAQGPSVTDGSTSSAPPPAPEAPRGLRAANRWLLGLVVVLAAALVGLGTWAIVDRSGGSRQPDAQALHDRAMAAWSSYDRPAVESVYAPDAQLRTTGSGSRGATLTGNESIGASVAILKLEGVRVARTSDFAASGEFGASFNSWTTTMGGAPESVLNVVQVRGGKIVRHWMFVLGSGVFDNVATEAT